MFRMYREIQTLDQNFSLKSLQNFSLSESFKMTPVKHLIRSYVLWLFPETFLTEASKMAALLVCGQKIQLLLLNTVVEISH